MNESFVTKSKSTSDSKTAVGRLFVLELSSNRIYSMRPDGSDRKVVVADCRLPDGIAIDVEAGHIYWTNMGLSPATNDGSIERADLDGGNRRVIVPPGVTHTPKQLQLDKKNGKLYWCDREGMRVMRANLDGSLIETLVETGRGDADRRDQTRWCVGIAIDPVRKQIYWTQKGPDNGRARPPPARRARHPQRRNRRQSLGHRGLLRPSAGADRSRTRSEKSRPLLDGSRRPAARQYGEPRLHRRQARGAGDPHHASDGRDRHRPRCPRRPDVRDRFRRLASIPRSSMGRASATSSSRRAISPASPTRKSEPSINWRNNHVRHHKAHSPNRHHRNGRHRRELGGAVPGEGTGRRGDRRCAGRRDVAETFRQGGLARPRAIGPRAGRVAIASLVHARPAGRHSKRPTSSRKTGPSGSTSRRSCIASSTSRWPPT